MPSFVPSNKIIIWLNFVIALIILLIGSGIVISFYQKPNDAIDWKKFSVFLLFGIYWNFFMYGSWVGVVNILSEKELRDR